MSQSLQESVSSCINSDPTKFKTLCSKFTKLLAKKHNLKNIQPKQIQERIYIGNYTFAINQAQLRKRNIKLIISCVPIDSRDRSDEIQYNIIKIKDHKDEKILSAIEKSNKIINTFLESKVAGNILINCFSGISRSVSILIGFMIFKLNLSFDQCWEKVKNSYPNAAPNQGFIQQLKKYSANQQNQISEKENGEKIDETKGQEKKKQVDKNNQKQENKQTIEQQINKTTKNIEKSQMPQGKNQQQNQQTKQVRKNQQSKAQEQYKQQNLQSQKSNTNQLQKQNQQENILNTHHHTEQAEQKIKDASMIESQQQKNQNEVKQDQIIDKQQQEIKRIQQKQQRQEGIQDQQSEHTEKSQHTQVHQKKKKHKKNKKKR